MAMLPCVPPISSIHVPWHKQQSLIFRTLRGKITLVFLKVVDITRSGANRGRFTVLSEEPVRKAQRKPARHRRVAAVDAGVSGFNALARQRIDTESSK